MTMPAQPVIVGGTYDWFLNPATINTEASPGVFGPWDITGATVTITFARYGNGQGAPPTSAAQHFTATVVSGPDGTTCCGSGCRCGCGRSAEVLIEQIRALGYSVQPAEAAWSLEMDQVDVLCLPL